MVETNLRQLKQQSSTVSAAQMEQNIDTETEKDV